MQKLRAVVFNTLFYGIFVTYMISILPTLLMSRRMASNGLMFVVRVLKILHRLFGINIVVRGRENIPAGGFLVAAKHQSIWETIMLPRIFADPAFIYKRELTRIPLYGWFMRKFDMVPIDRSEGAKTLRKMTVLSAKKIAEGRQLIIFPEGTRRPIDSPPDYKTGVALLYSFLKGPVLPVALNSGAYWSSYLWSGKRGTITIDILPAIPPGLDKQVFLKTLEERLETAMRTL